MWHFIIHGGIDGFSRMIVFLHCNTNNRLLTEDLTEGVIQKDAVCIISSQKDQGGICSWDVPLFFTICFITRRVVVSLSLPTSFTCLLYTMYSYPESKEISKFSRRHITAPLSAERGSSPTQLWIRGMLGVAHSQRSVALEFNNPEVM